MTFFTRSKNDDFFSPSLIFLIAFQLTLVYSVPEAHASFKNDLNILQEQLKKKEMEGQEEINIILSPYLIRTSNHIAANISDAIVGKKPPLPMPELGTSFKGLHLVSKTLYIDEHLYKFKIPHTSSYDLKEQTTEFFAQEINAKIEKETNGMIKNFAEIDTLNSPTIKYILYTWFYQKVNWEKPFSVHEQTMLWNGKENNQIQWMAQKRTMRYREKNGLGIVSIPIKEQGIRAIIIFDKERALDIKRTEDISWLLDNPTGRREVTLIMPQCDFKYTFLSSTFDHDIKHAAALKIDRNGAEIGAAASYRAHRGSSIEHNPINPITVIINHPFIFGFVKNKSLIGAAYINQP